MPVRSRTIFTLLLCAVLISCEQREPPYPPSNVITDITWSSSPVKKAKGSDTWPVTWAEDDRLYTVFGDGHGFVPRVPVKLSLGFAEISGHATDFKGVNIRSPSGEQTGHGPAGKKASGMLMVDGVIYMLVRNADNNGKQCQLAWSQDKARSWEWSTWKFEELGYCAFLNYGRNYANSRDDYVYIYSPDSASAYLETDKTVLLRVKKGKIRDRTAYMFFAGIGENGNPEWSSDYRQRKSVFTFPGGVNRLDVTYSSPHGRYLLTMRSQGVAGGENHFSIYDAPEPWGPWRTVYYDATPDAWGESQHIPAKWISADGKRFYLVSSGSDSFTVTEATLGINIPDNATKPSGGRESLEN